MRTPIVLLCALAIGLALHLVAQANHRPAQRRGAPITSPAKMAAPPTWV